eukprot:scaffold49383_cov27-Tisochrysis_lutea.AAC.16
MEAIEVHAIVGPASHVDWVLVDHQRLVDDLIQGPARSNILAAYLLQVGGKEAVRVEEAGKPVRRWPASLEPIGKVVDASHDVGEPHRQTRRLQL